MPFILLADTKKEIIHAYQAGGVFTKRITYLIDPKGYIIEVYPKVTPSVHAEQLVNDIELLHDESFKS